MVLLRIVCLSILFFFVVVIAVLLFFLYCFQCHKHSAPLQSVSLGAKSALRNKVAFL